MWQTVDYKGNTVKWYEAELIEDLVRLCKTEIALDNWGKYFAEKILKIIEDFS